MRYQMSFINFWILASATMYQASFAQIFISPELDTLQSLCLEEEVNITCETRGSPILAWTSDEYIEQGGTQLEFATFNNVGDTRISPVNPNTIATLINNTIENGVTVLVSQLRIIVSVGSTVTCMDVATGIPNSVSIQLLDSDDYTYKPQVLSHQVLDLESGRCDLHLMWNVPAKNDSVGHFMVNINGTHIANESAKQDLDSILTVYPLCSCDSHNISISTVDRCGGTDNRNTYTIKIQDQVFQHELPGATLCSTPTTTTTGGNRTIYIEQTTTFTTVIAIVLATVFGVLCIFLLITNICTCVALRQSMHLQKIRRNLHLTV